MSSANAEPRYGPSLLQQVWHYRWQIWVDFRKDLIAQYRETFGRTFWLLFLPVVPLSVYLLLSAMGVFTTRGGMNGLVYISVGATLWYLFSGFVTQGMSAFASKGRVAVRASYPLIAATASSYGLQIFDFIMRVIFCAVVLSFVEPPNWRGLLYLAPFLLPPILLFFGIGLIFAVFSTAIHDLQKLIPLFLQYAFFLSLVLFPLPDVGLIHQALRFNPFAVFIDNARHLLLHGTLSDPLAYAVWSILGVGVFLWALRFFKVAQLRVAEHL